MLGFGGDELGDDPEAWLGRLHPDDRPAVEQRLQAHREGVLPHFESEHRIRHRDGSYVWVLARGLAVRDDTGVCYRMAGSQSDITERKRTEQQLVHDAFHDGLTGLPNRALFLDRLSQAIRVAAKRRDAGFAVLFLDLDRFKVINDSLGHLVGDRLLVEMARRLETCVRPEDTVARLGGDEFALLLDDLVDPSMALRVAERSQREAARSWSIDGHEGVTTVSIGIALSESGYEKPEDVLRDADIAMYRAKGLGKARHAVFDTEMHARSMAVLELEMDLRRAIDRRELSVYYQPIVSLVDGCLQGFEALVRWHHPERGLILPEEFVPLAEETGLIVPIGDIVLASVARELASWRRLYPEFPVHVTVNLSARQLAQTELVSEIARTLAEADLESPMLRFEITETALMEDHDAMARTLTQLRELDVRVYLDDFGTGYSSLSYLQRLPIDFLKIDRSFVQSLGEESGDGAMVRAIVTLARHLEMDVVAEGVETDYQATVLREIGCQQAQGFLFSPPLPCEHAVELVAGRHRYSLPAGGGGSGPSSAGIRRTPTS
jgi:diguanylate cyclase (GGDEF)-like protein/PAS domain S-box-containing protein